MSTENQEYVKYLFELLVDFNIIHKPVYTTIIRQLSQQDRTNYNTAFIKMFGDPNGSYFDKGLVGLKELLKHYIDTLNNNEDLGEIATVIIDTLKSIGFFKHYSSSILISGENIIKNDKVYAEDMARFLISEKTKLEAKIDIRSTNIKQMIGIKTNIDKEIDDLLANAKLCRDVLNSMGIDVDRSYNLVQAIGASVEIAVNGLLPIYTKYFLTETIENMALTYSIDLLPGASSSMAQIIVDNNVSKDDIMNNILNDILVQMITKDPSIRSSISLLIADIEAMSRSYKLINTISNTLTNYDETQAEIEARRKNYSNEQIDLLKIYVAEYISLNAVKDFIKILLTDYPDSSFRDGVYSNSYFHNMIMDSYKTTIAGGSSIIKQADIPILYSTHGYSLGYYKISSGFDYLVNLVLSGDKANIFHPSIESGEITEYGIKKRYIHATLSRLDDYIFYFYSSKVWNSFIKDYKNIRRNSIYKEF
jgi:hypothetical protein